MTKMICPITVELFGHVERFDDEVGAKVLVVLGFDDRGDPQVPGCRFHQPAYRPIGARNERMAAYASFAYISGA